MKIVLSRPIKSENRDPYDLVKKVIRHGIYQREDSSYRYRDWKLGSEGELELRPGYRWESDVDCANPKLWTVNRVDHCVRTQKVMSEGETEKNLGLVSLSQCFKTAVQRLTSTVWLWIQRTKFFSRLNNTIAPGVPLWIERERPTVKSSVNLV